MKKKPSFNQEMAIRGVNRRLFARSPIVREKLEESRKEFPRYKKDGTRAKKNLVKRQCEVCGSWVSTTKITVDHIDPVVPLDGFPPHYDLWERITLFLKRLWCDKSNLQRICDDCHRKKTQRERLYRLNVKYMAELDDIEKQLDILLSNTSDVDAAQLKALSKLLSKYIAKRKTSGMESVVERAVSLKSRIPRR